MVSLRIHSLPAALLLSFAGESWARGEFTVLRLLLNLIQSFRDARNLYTTFLALLALAVAVLPVDDLDLALEFLVALQREETLLACF